MRIPDQARRRIATALQSVHILNQIQGGVDGSREERSDSVGSQLACQQEDEDVVATQQFRTSRLGERMVRALPLLGSDSGDDEFGSTAVIPVDTARCVEPRNAEEGTELDEEAKRDSFSEARKEMLDGPLVEGISPKRKLERQSSMSSLEQLEGLMTGGASSLGRSDSRESSAESLGAIELERHTYSQISLEARLRKWLTKREKKEIARHRREIERHKREMEHIRSSYEKMRKRICTGVCNARNPPSKGPPCEEECMFQETTNPAVEPVEAKQSNCFRPSAGALLEEHGFRVGSSSPKTPPREGPSSVVLASGTPDVQRTSLASHRLPETPPREIESPDACKFIPRDSANDNSRSIATSYQEPIDLTENVSDEENHPHRTPRNSSNGECEREDCIIVLSASVPRKGHRSCISSDSDSGEILPLSQRLNFQSQGKPTVGLGTPLQPCFSDDETPAVASEEEIMDLIGSDKENTVTPNNSRIHQAENLNASQEPLVTLGHDNPEILSLVEGEDGPTGKRPPSRLKRPEKVSAADVLSAIRLDKHLYDDILMMETIPFVRIMKSVRESGVNVSEKALIVLLRREGVSFKAEAPKDGARARRYFKNLSTDFD